MLDNKSVGLDCMTKGRHQPPQQFDKDILDRAFCLSLSHNKSPLSLRVEDGGL